MKALKSLILCGVGIAALSLTSCNDWLDVNNDPDHPTDVQARYQDRLAHIQFYTNSSHAFAGWRTSFTCGDWTNHSGNYRSLSYWLPTAGLTTTPYQWWFVGAYVNVGDMYDKAMAAENWQYAGAAKLIKAYGFMLMTDLYGEMPYNEAGTNTYVPKYNTGKEIFLGCLADLDQAIELLEKGRNMNPLLPTLSDGDQWANGDLNKWIKFAHLLKARWLVQLTKKAPGSYKEGKYDAETILAELDKAMQSNEDNMIVNHTDDNGSTHDILGWNEPVDYSPLHSVCGMNAGYYVTKMLYNNLTNFAGYGVEDPRADHIIPWVRSEKSANSPAGIKWQEVNIDKETTIQWRRSAGVDMSDAAAFSQGMPLRVSFDTKAKRFYINSKLPDRLGDTIYVEQTSTGKGYAKQPDIMYRRGGADYDRSTESGTFYTRVSSPTYLGTYMEVCFIRAEVLFRKGDKAGAYEAYKKGIQASMELMNEKLEKWIQEDNKLQYCPSFVPMTKEQMDNFLANGIGTAGDITLGKIMTQKRIALMFTMEVWNDMRRYDYDPQIFLGWSKPAFYSMSTAAMKAVPEGKTPRRWQQCSHEINFNISNLIEIGKQVPGAKTTSKSWNQEDDVWTIPVWWDSDQE